LWVLLMTYVKRCPTEINGFGLIRRTGVDGLTFEVEDIFIIKQRATGHDVEVDETAFMQLMYELTVAEKAHLLHLQWHSHVQMAAYFSTTDHASIEETPRAEGSWLVSLVVNQHGELQARVDWFEPLRCWFWMEVRVTHPPVPSITEKVDADIRQLVRRAGLPMIKPRPRGLPEDYSIGATQLEVES
jgi:hypothetical protein